MVIAGVTIDRQPSYDSSWATERIGQDLVETLDGGKSVYNNTGLERIKGEIILKGVLPAQAEALRTALRTTIDYQYGVFTISGLGANTDVGAGRGVSIADVTLDGTSLAGVFEYIPPGKYNIKIGYFKNVL